MKIIKVFTTFGNSKNAMEVYKRLYHLEEDPNYNVKYKFTIDDDYTHAFILNTAMPQLKVPKENVIGMAFEPLEYLNLSNIFIDYAKKYIGKYYIGDTSRLNLPEPFIEHYSYMWHITVPKSIFVKNNPWLNQGLNLMSIMVSDKYNLSGHKYRHILTQHILRLNLPIDIYGRGCKFYNNLNDKRVKGNFEELEPYEKYYFHIAIENSETPHYFSEKITNPLLCNTNVLYLGCKNIDKYFGNYVYKLNGKIENDLDLIKKICDNYSIFYNKIDRDEIVKKISILNII
jgi:hypothetical protein